jgi:methionine biosynthesis protein MetW
MPGSAAHEYYDAYWRTGDWVTSLPPKLLGLLEARVSRTDECLEVGCGDGGTSGTWLHENAARYVGVDISDAAVRLSRERGLDARQVADASDLPFADRSFDVVVCVEVLEHLFEPQRALAEAHRLLREGGRLIATVPNVAHWRNRLDLALLGRLNPRGDHLSAAQPWRDPHLRFFTLRSLSSLVIECGFRILERGGHTQHGLAEHLPGVRRLTRTRAAGPVSRSLAARFPRPLAETIYVVAERH